MWTPMASAGGDRRYRIVAGSAMSPEQLRLAAIGDALGIDRKLNCRHWVDAERAEIEANGDFSESGWRAVTSSDGVVCFIRADE
jgi:hypothetical protein